MTRLGLVRNGRASCASVPDRWGEVRRVTAHERKRTLNSKRADMVIKVKVDH